MSEVLSFLSTYDRSNVNRDVVSDVNVPQLACDDNPVRNLVYYYYYSVNVTI